MYAEPKENLIANADHCLHKAALYLMDANWYLDKAGLSDEAAQMSSESKVVHDLRRKAIPKSKRGRK